MNNKLCHSIALSAAIISLLSLHFYRIRIPLSSVNSSAMRLDLDLDHPLPVPDSVIPESMMCGSFQSVEYAVERYAFLPRKLDINDASATLLQAIRGIGPSTAAIILLERIQRGRFRDLEDFIRRTGVKREVIEPVSEWLYAGN